MDFTKTQVTVIADDKLVAVNGETYKVRMSFPAELHALRWVPQAAETVRGYIERKVGDSHHFQDFANIEPYMKAWEIAKAEADAAAKKAQSEADEARRAAEREGMRANEEAQRKGREAQLAFAEEQKALADKQADEIRARAAEHAKQMEAQAAEQRAQMQARAALEGALIALNDSDHEVIKAMEAKLTAEGALSSDLVSRRQAAREIARTEKQKRAQ